MIKREPYIDIIIGPQSYHKINKIIENFNFNKKEELTEFDTEDKFNYLDKIKNHEIIDLKTISAFNIFDNYYKNDLPEFNKK